MNKLKILFAHDVPLIKNTTDGLMYSSTFTKKLWNRYLSHDIELTVCSRQLEKKIEDTANYGISSAENVYFKKIPSISSLKNMYHNRKIAKDILKESISGVDGVIVRLPSEIGLLTYQIAKGLQKPVLIEMVGCPEDAYKFHGSMLGKLYSKPAKKKYQKSLKSASYVLYVSKEFLQKKYPTQGLRASASNVLLSSKDQEVLEKRMKMIREKKYIYKIGIIGNLNVKYKGIDDALKAFSLLNKDLKIKLEIVGGGSSSIWKKKAAELNISDNVLFKGKLSNDEVINWLDTIDVYIQPSKTEGLPRALIEAMSRGCACVASDVGGIPELLSEKHLHKPNDYNRLYKKINSFIEIESSRLEAASTNIKKADEYLPDRLKDKRDNLYTKFFSDIRGK
ncbi:hypothetical protein BBI15_07540 [Planococcus plakortidis]|uniref:Glycosyl transferase family 1 domain-containing protein n=1 Tax=Planococcus plakortidis TaxID=1038856 RepID=A0A1C7E9E4_9BACL|nr:glycosyltransferase [Planococcus plakortidis]ANU20077.1 hypothetical protein BBI15_07540 [Planococcus plakortidis]